MVLRTSLIEIDGKVETLLQDVSVPESTLTVEAAKDGTLVLLVLVV